MNKRRLKPNSAETGAENNSGPVAKLSEQVMFFVWLDLLAIKYGSCGHMAPPVKPKKTRRYNTCSPCMDEPVRYPEYA